MIYDEEGWDQIRDTWMAQDEALKQIGHSESTAFSRIIKAFLAGEKNLAFSPTTVLYALLLLGQMTEGECRREIYDALSFIEMGVAAACAPQSAKKIDFILKTLYLCNYKGESYSDVYWDSCKFIRKRTCVDCFAQ